ncbi:MAG: NAD(P)-dependent oxidoreductase [Phycisphaerales bacterium]|nr:NAD(P)-dependent oxidoreductase [Phycisphaerales bacterium]
MSAKVGFIGLGIMGRPMAGHLARAGHDVVVFTRTRDKASALLAEGVEWRDSPAALAADRDVVFLCVTDTPDVENVLFGADGVAGSIRAGSVVVDHSTIAPAGARAFAERLAGQGVAMLDAPITGGEIGAQNATLTIMVGGDAAAFQRVEPLLKTMGRTVRHVGPSGAGQALKACNQILCAVNVMGVCEAILLARQSGIDPATAIETLGGGAGGSWAWTQLGRKIVDGDLNPAFMIRLMQKDLRIVQSAAQENGVPLPGTALAQQLFRAVESRDAGGDLGTQAMIRAYEGMMG